MAYHEVYTDRQCEQIRNACKEGSAIVHPNATLEQAIAVLFLRYTEAEVMRAAYEFSQQKTCRPDLDN